MSLIFDSKARFVFSGMSDSDFPLLQEVLISKFEYWKLNSDMELEFCLGLNTSENMMRDIYRELEQVVQWVRENNYRISGDFCYALDTIYHVVRITSCPTTLTLVKTYHTHLNASDALEYMHIILKNMELSERYDSVWQQQLMQHLNCLQERINGLETFQELVKISVVRTGQLCLVLGTVAAISALVQYLSPNQK